MVTGDFSDAIAGIQPPRRPQAVDAAGYGRCMAVGSLVLMPLGTVAEAPSITRQAPRIPTTFSAYTVSCAETIKRRRHIIATVGKQVKLTGAGTGFRDIRCLHQYYYVRHCDISVCSLHGSCVSITPGAYQKEKG